MANGITTFLENNPTLAIGGAVVGVLLVGGLLLRKSTSTTATTDPNGAPASDLSGLGSTAGGHIVYVPTQTTFSTDNRTVGADFSNDPSLQTIQTGQIGPISSPVSTGSTSTTTTTTNTPAPVVVVPPVVKPPTTGQPPPQGGSAGTGTPPPRATPPPTPTPAPKPTPAPAKSLKWDQGYTISGGETLSGIAAKITRTCRAQGMPGSQSVSWNDLYAHNTTVINATSAAHHNPIPGGPWNDIFPGERITVPRWG